MKAEGVDRASDKKLRNGRQESPGLRGEGGRRWKESPGQEWERLRFSFGIGEGKLVADQCLIRFTMHHGHYRNACFCCCSNLTGSLTFA